MADGSGNLSAVSSCGTVKEFNLAIEQALKFEMPPILLKPLSWFEQDRPKLYEQLVQPLFDTYDI